MHAQTCTAPYALHRLLLHFIDCLVVIKRHKSTQDTDAFSLCLHRCEQLSSGKVDLKVVGFLHVVACQLERVNKLLLRFFFEHFEAEFELTLQVDGEGFNHVAQSHLFAAHSLHMHFTFKRK